MVTVTLILVFCLVVNSKCDQFLTCLEAHNSTAEIVRRGDNKYEYHNYQWNVRKLKNPKGFIVVNSSEDVRSAVECLVKLELKFRTKCGGNSIEKYSFEDDFWIIDLVRLDNVEVDEETKIATVGAGIRLQTLSMRLWEIGKYALPVGSCFSVGVSGFTLGGGFGPGSRNYGMMVDRLIGLEVVTADAKILLVNEEQHSDLFWALRGGGGGNLAIATKFYFKTFDAPSKMISVKSRYTLKSFPIAFRFWQNWLKSNPNKSIGSLISYSAQEKYVDFEFDIYDNDYDNSVRHLKNIKQYFPFIRDAEHVKYLGFIDTLTRISTPYFSNSTTVPFYYKTTSFFVSKYLTNNEIEIFAKVMADNKDSSFLLETYGGAINQRSKTDTAFCHRDSFYVVQFGITAYSDMYPNLNATITNGDKMKQQLRNIRKNLQFMSNGESYINYIDDEIPDPFKAYYCNNSNLMEVKKKYDYDDIFKFPLSVPLP